VDRRERIADKRGFFLYDGGLGFHRRAKQAKHQCDVSWWRFFGPSPRVEKCRERLQRFLVDLVEPLGRSERKHWSEVYIRGLLLDGERKSIEPLAARVGDGNVQAMQQLVGQSPWEWIPVWERLAKRMTAELEPDSAWVVDDTGFPKQGDHSVGVERQYSGTLGKVGNCQVAVSLHHVGEQGHTILGWRLYLPETWVKDGERRKEAGIPKDIFFKTKWQLGLDIIDQARGWGLEDRIVVSDGGYGESTEFRDGLEARRLAYVVGISPTLGVWTKPPKAAIPPPHSGRALCANISETSCPSTITVGRGKKSHLDEHKQDKYFFRRAAGPPAPGSRF
jgi:SRSO17 transposase